MNAWCLSHLDDEFKQVISSSWGLRPLGGGSMCWCREQMRVCECKTSRGTFYIHYKMLDKITYPPPNFNACTDVWAWISNFSQHFIIDVITWLIDVTPRFNMRQYMHNMTYMPMFWDSYIFHFQLGCLIICLYSCIILPSSALFE